MGRKHRLREPALREASLAAVISLVTGLHPGANEDLVGSGDARVFFGDRDFEWLQARFLFGPSVKGQQILIVQLIQDLL